MPEEQQEKKEQNTEESSEEVLGIPHEEFMLDIPNPYKKGKNLKVRAWRFKIPWNEGTAEVVVRKLLFGESNSLTQQFLQIKMYGKTPVPEFNYEAMVEQTMLKSVHSAPWPVKDIAEVRCLDPDIGEIVYAKAEAMNDLNAIKKMFSGKLT